MQKFVILLICMLSMIALAPVMAQEDDVPANNPSDNWCFDGGPLEGKCGLGDTDESQWYWLYGYFAAQVAKGEARVIDLPEEFRIGLQDRTFDGTTASVGTNSENGIFRDGDGNIIASGPSRDFFGYLKSCEFGDKGTQVYVGWMGLEVTGDRIEVGTPDGAASSNTLIELSNDEFRLKFGDPTETIEEDGTMNIYRGGFLIGSSELNGLICEDTTD